MANLYEAGIVITADTQAAAGAIGSLINDLARFEESARALSVARGPTAAGAGGASEEFVIEEDAAGAMQQLMAGTSAAQEEFIVLEDDATDAFQAATDGAITLEESIEGAGEETRSFSGDLASLGNDLNEVRKSGTDAFKEIAGGALDFVSALANVGNTIQSIIGGGLFQIDQQAARLHGRLGEGEQAIAEFKSTVISLNEETKVAPEIIGDLAYNMRAAGLEFSVADEAARNNAVALTKMVGVLGMSVEETTQFASNMRLLGGSVADFTDEVDGLEKKYKLIELMEESAKFTGDVIKAQAQFGKSAVKEGRRASVAIARMAGVYKHALGKTAAEAANDAREAFSAFAGETRSYRDVFLGLSDDFSPLQTAFLETGMGVERMGRLMESAQTDQVGFIEEVKRIQSTLDPQMAERFYVQVLRHAPQAVKVLLTQEEAYARMTEEQRRAHSEEAKAREDATKRQGNFNATVDRMRDNVVDAYTVFQSLFRGLTVAAAQEFAEGLREGFQELTVIVGKVIQGFEDLRAFFKGNESALDEYGETLKRVASFVRSLFGEGTDERAEKFKKLVKKITVITIGLGTALGAVSTVGLTVLGVLGPLWKIVSTVGKHLFTFVKGILGAGKGSGKLAGSMKVLGAVFRKIALPIGIALSLFDGFKDRIDDIGTAIQEGDWEEVFSQVLGGFGDSINSFFLGLPQRFIDGFKGSTSAFETEGAETFGETVGEILGKGTTAIIDWWGKDALPAIKKFFTPAEMKKFGMGLLRGLAAIGHQIIGFAKGVATGFLKQFGLKFSALPILFDIIWLKMQKYAWTAMIAIGNVTWDVISKMKGYWVDLKTGAEIVFEKLRYWSNPANLIDPSAEAMLNARIKKIEEQSAKELATIKEKRDAERAATDEFIKDIDREIRKKQAALNEIATAESDAATARELARLKEEKQRMRMQQIMDFADKNRIFKFEEAKSQLIAKELKGRLAAEEMERRLATAKDRGMSMAGAMGVVMTRAAEGREGVETSIGLAGAGIYGGDEETAEQRRARFARQETLPVTQFKYEVEFFEEFERRMQKSKGWEKLADEQKGKIREYMEMVYQQRIIKQMYGDEKGIIKPGAEGAKADWTMWQGRRRKMELEVFFKDNAAMSLFERAIHQFELEIVDRITD